MVFIFFLFFLIFHRPVLADTPVVEITDYSSGTDEIRLYEWVKLSNNTDNDINIDNWILRDKNDNTNNKDSIILTGCIPKNSFKIFTHSKGWLNDEEDSIYLFDSTKIEIDNYSYTVKKITDQPNNTSVCTITSIPTIGTTNTDIATTVINIAVTDSTIINPTSGVSISEFMPYSSIEWIEIYNNNSNPVEIKGWKIKDNSSNTKTIPDLKISSNSFAVFEFSSFLNNDFDKIILINHLDQEINQFEYPNNKDTLERSWSLINNSWCQSDITKNSTNVSSCYSEVTSTPTITASVTPSLTPKITPTTIPTDRNLYKPDELATATAVFTPTEETDYYLTPTILAKPISSNLVLGETTTAKKNYLPLVFIISGGSLLISPIIIEKLKKK